MPKKLTYEYVKKYFEEQGCELLETEYINAITKMQYKCQCGNISSMAWDFFQRGHRCKKCASLKIGKSNKYSYEYVKQFFKENNCELLEDNYIDSRQNLIYKCSCGNISLIQFYRFLNGQRCKKCANITIGNKLRLSYDYIKSELIKYNYYLLSKEYINNSTKLEMICPQGHLIKMTFSAFSYGYRCRICSRPNKENHYNWNPNLTDLEREKNNSRTQSVEYKIWKISIFSKNRVCVYCNGKNQKSRNDINAHHLNCWDVYPNERLNIHNGVTLCTTCHKTFHKKYGYKNSTKEQFEEWMKERKA